VFARRRMAKASAHQTTRTCIDKCRRLENRPPCVSCPRYRTATDRPPKSRAHLVHSRSMPTSFSDVPFYGSFGIKNHVDTPFFCLLCQAIATDVDDSYRATALRSYDDSCGPRRVQMSANPSSRYVLYKRATEFVKGKQTARKAFSRPIVEN